MSRGRPGGKGKGTNVGKGPFGTSAPLPRPLDAGLVHSNQQSGGRGNAVTAPPGQWLNQGNALPDASIVKQPEFDALMKLLRTEDPNPLGQRALADAATALVPSGRSGPSQRGHARHSTDNLQEPRSGFTAATSSRKGSAGQSSGSSYGRYAAGGGEIAADGVATYFPLNVTGDETLPLALRGQGFSPNHDEYNQVVEPDTDRDNFFWLIPSWPCPIFSNRNAFAALHGNGQVLSWGDPGSGGDSDPVSEQLRGGVCDIRSTQHAFAALKIDGTVVVWGDAEEGGDDSRAKAALAGRRVERLFSTRKAFAACLKTGGVATWGDSEWGGDSSLVSDQLNDSIRSIFSTSGAFAALKSDGSVVTWGDQALGGDSTSVHEQLLDGVVQVGCTVGAFAAVKDAGNIITWGAAGWGGDGPQSSVIFPADCQLCSNHGAFAAVASDGSVVAWGDEKMGGNCENVAEVLKDIRNLHSTDGAFAAITKQGSVVSWGCPDWGGDMSLAQKQLESGVSHIASTKYAFAAIKYSGHIVTWGAAHAGGDNSDVSHDLDGGSADMVKSIYSTDFAFAALKQRGCVVTWGLPPSGGDSRHVAHALKEGVACIGSTSSAFVAVKTEGALITWGDSEAGGSFTSMSGCRPFGKQDPQHCESRGEFSGGSLKFLTGLHGLPKTKQKKDSGSAQGEVFTQPKGKGMQSKGKETCSQPLTNNGRSKGRHKPSGRFAADDAGGARVSVEDTKGGHSAFEDNIGHIATEDNGEAKGNSKIHSGRKSFFRGRK